MRVDGRLVRPAVVGLPGVVAALKQHVGRAVVADDEDHVALPIGLVHGVGQRGEPAQVDAAGPVGGDRQFDGRLPTALVHGPRVGLRRGLRLAVEGAELLHQPRSAAAVVARAKDLDLILRGRLGGNHDLESLAGRHALLRAVAFDVQAAAAVGLVHTGPRELPVGRAFVGVLLLDGVRLGGRAVSKADVADKGQGRRSRCALEESASGDGARLHNVHRAPPTGSSWRGGISQFEIIVGFAARGCQATDRIRLVADRKTDRLHGTPGLPWKFQIPYVIIVSTPSSGLALGL